MISSHSVREMRGLKYQYLVLAGLVGKSHSCEGIRGFKFSRSRPSTGTAYCHTLHFYDRLCKVKLKSLSPPPLTISTHKKELLTPSSPVSSSFIFPHQFNQFNSFSPNRQNHRCNPNPCKYNAAQSCANPIQLGRFICIAGFPLFRQLPYHFRFQKCKNTDYYKHNTPDHIPNHNSPSFPPPFSRVPESPTQTKKIDRKSINNQTSIPNQSESAKSPPSPSHPAKARVTSRFTPSTSASFGCPRALS